MDANNDMFNPERRQFHLDRYFFAQPFCEDKLVLDGACGTGYGTAILGEKAKQAIGIDISPDTIDYATNTYGAQNIHFQRSTVEYTAFEDAAFDVIVSFETVEHTLCPISHMMEISRLLKPNNGKAILSVPNNWGLTDHHFFDFNYSLFKELLDQFFDEVEYLYQIPRDKNTNIQHIGALSDIGEKNAQCIIAVCSNVIKQDVSQDRLSYVMTEIYKNAFIRHNEYRTLLYRQNTPLITRIINKLKLLIS
ncbi:MAG: class I SAM-dependent methyltransferase [Methylomonas sp.]|jgi:SAM-dependent methyltransferase|uniref:class I SAM-dependent methyltransferase n=1 Tax=Methylomonas sp. TaxID=418 RepID=UPI0025D3223C|nr:class I SAM-dependent methyltransferase [Methylomonas sp.]MCK9606068.1 class I SAM-dependent methyltransferase [Methylomonas sp.]